MRILHVSPSLPVDVCTQAVSLSNHGWLDHLYTSAATNGKDSKGWLLNRWLGRREVQIRGDELRAIYTSDVHQRLRLLAGKSRTESMDERFKRVDYAASRQVNDGLDAVLCREDAARHTFEQARDYGIIRIYDLPTAHFEFTQDLMKKEVECFPELERSISIADDYAVDRISNKERELSFANHILCPSQFVRRSLVAGGYGGKSIQVLPFACDRGWLRESSEKRTNVVLGVGQISVRKGVHRLLKVWKQMGAYRTHTLRLVGDMRLPRAYLKQFKGIYEHVPSLPRKDLIRQYATAKMLVLNSMSEGMAIVIPEALSVGTPVLASCNSGAEEMVTDHEEGLLVDYGDDEALARSLELLLTSPELLRHMGDKAKIRARTRTWSFYSREFIEWIDSVVTKMSISNSA
ncbi:MAG: hypothetical protein BMS9Abin05_1238 [Rhodothermia bacterium]|nr:MAG: hypothetical protein BMS9Abin05_1238 [Rhodothermia bacterium]